MIDEKGMPFSRARANTNREDACNWARTCKMRTMTIKQQTVIAPGFEIAFVRIYPYTKKLGTWDNRRQDLQKQKNEISQ